MIQTHTTHSGKLIHVGTVGHYATVFERVKVKAPKTSYFFDDYDKEVKMCEFCGVVALKRGQQKYCCQKCKSAGYVREHSVNEKVCKQCGKHFVSRSPIAKFCSNQCSADSRKVATQQCKQCGKMFAPRKQSSRLCSVACLAAYRTKPKQPKPCPVCHNNFIPVNKWQQTCGFSCGGKLRFVRDKER
ncbi:MAG: hypothetical protein RL755_53 [Pseudomonadota bacterium]|jgi:hypothetical protein